jgi:hypothetical protein
LALGLIIGGNSAAGAIGGCISTVAGVELTCVGQANNPDAFTAASDFTVNIGTTTPNDPAEITRDNTSDHAGLKIDGGGFGGTINMTRGSSITVDPGVHGSSFRNGLSVLSSAVGASKTYTIDIDGSIVTNDAQGDALRLEGHSGTVFDVTVHRHGTIGGEDGDDSIMVTGAQSLLLKNYGEIAGGNGQPSTGGEGINVGNGTRIAAEGVTIENHGSITGRGDAGVNGQGITVFGAGDVHIDNSRRGDIVGASQGIHVEADGAVSISNDGHIEGHSESGVEVADGTDVEITNRSRHTIEGATDGVFVHNVDEANIDNDHGRIVGHDGDGVHVHNVDGAVSVQNRFGASGWNAARISGSDDGVHISRVEDDVSVDNRFGGKIIGHGDDGIDIHNAGDDVTIANSFGGSVSGRENGVNVHDVRDNVRIDNGFGGSISGERDDGVHIRDVRGDVDVSNRFGGRIGGRDDGIDADHVRGDVTVSNDFGGHISARRGDGVKIEDVGDDVRISNSFGGQIHGRDDGVHVDGVRDHVTVNNSIGGSIVGYADDGIDIDDVRDDVDIFNRFGGTIAGRDAGVEVSDSGDDVRIDNAFGGTIAGWRADGVRIDDTDGFVAIDNSRGGKISGGGDGVHVTHADDGVRIDNSFGGSIEGRHDDGIDVRDVDDDVRIDNRFGGSIAGDDHGLKVHDVDGSVAIANSFGGKIRGDGGNGIDIDDVDDNLRIDNRRGGSISGRNDGVHSDDVDGNVRIDNGSGSIRGRRGDGVDVSAEGDVTVNNGRLGRIEGADSAIEIDAQSAEINSAGLIRGSGTDHPTIKISTEGGATINNYRSGKIVGHDYSPTDMIVKAHGGPVTINNDGTMLGRIDLSDAGNTQEGNVFNNTSNHSWTFTGTSNLGGGFSDAYNNSGTVFTTDPGRPENNDVTELAGVEAFNNGSSFRTGTIDLQDGFTGDVTTLSPTSGATLTFNGAAGHSYLKVDSYLGSPTNSSSDRLLIDGDVTGKTAIDVNNVNPGFGSYNPVGIEVVKAAGSSSANNFFLRNGPIDTGLFDYNLYLKNPNDWVLASAPNRTFFELPSLISAAQSMWHDASGVWLDRTADLRASLEHPCVSEGLKGPSSTCPPAARAGGWVKGLGVTESRTPKQSFSLFNTAQTYKTGYDQSGGGVLAGYDVVRRADDGQSIWLAGVMGGYLRSVVDFDNSATGVDFEGGAVGGYVTYLKGPWFLDAKLLANIGNVEYSGSHGVKDSAGVTSIGGVLDTGYRMDRGRYFIEPGATLAYVDSNIDSLGIYGSSVGFSNGDSLRGRLGLRVGMSLQDQQAKYEPFLGMSAWYEFLGDNTAQLASNGYTLGATDNVSGAIGELSGGVDVYSLAGDGLSGFVKGNLQFGKDDYLGFGGSFGVRVDW